MRLGDAEAHDGVAKVVPCSAMIRQAKRASRFIAGLLQRVGQARLMRGCARVAEASAHVGVTEARTNIEMCRLLCLKAADMMDKVGNKVARTEIAMIKVAAPRMALQIIDDAIQAWGGAGVTTDSGLARMYASQRTLRLADGPDEVHNRTIARLEYGKYMNLPRRQTAE